MTPHPFPNPLKLGTAADFNRARALLLEAGYNEPAICRRLGISTLTQFDLDSGRRPVRNIENPDPLDLLIRLFLEGDPVPAASLGAALSGALAGLGLIAMNRQDPSLCSGTVLLHPMRGLHIASDRPSPIEPVSEPKPFDDFVYPAMIPNTDLFLSLLEPDLSNAPQCEAYLELCGGTGIAALAAARAGARQAYSYDITERSTFFAAFNCRLNGIANLTAAAGDLYDPAGPLTFDRIVAHPPYVPVFRPHLIFDSGGQDGEQIVRRIVEGLPRYLRPGGRFYSLTMGSDRQTGGAARSFEQRIRGWLGTAESEFDVLFVNRRTLTPREWAAESIIRSRGSVDDIPKWRGFFEELGVQSLVYGLVMIQRREGARPVVTLRRQTGTRTGPAEHAWLLDWETRNAQGSGWLLGERLQGVDGTELRVSHILANGEWQPEGYLLETAHPFNNEIRAQAWTAHLLALANGTLTGAELLDQLKTAGALHPDTPPADFAEMIATLVSGGFLRLSS